MSSVMLLYAPAGSSARRKVDTYDQGEGLTELVGTVGRSGSVGTGQLVQHPRGGSVQALKVVLGSANHCKMRSDALQKFGDCRCEIVVEGVGDDAK